MADLPVDLTRRRDQLVTAGGRVLVLTALLVAWELYARARPEVGSSFAGAVDVGAALVALLFDGSFWTALGLTLRSTLVGLGLCVVIGLPLGLLVASHTAVATSTRFLIDFLRTIPPLAIVPLLLLLYGPTARMQIILIVAMGVWPIAIQTIHAVRDIDPELLRTARVFRLPPWRRVAFVMAPASLPYLATGVRICATFSLLSAVGAELVAGVPGLGQEILLRQQAGLPDQMLAATLWCGALGAVLAFGLAAAEHRLLGWFHRPRGATS